MDTSNSTEHEFFVQWHLTERCNLRCLHCYQSGKLPREMSLEEIRETAAEVGEMLSAWEDAYSISFDKSYNITGGEPFLRADLFEILKIVGEPGFEIFLLTNGTLIGEKEAGKLAELGVSEVQISVEGPEEVHDRIRGAGSFRGAFRGAKALIGEGVPVSLNVTLSTVNADFTRELVSLASELGAGRLTFSRLVPCGRGSALASGMIPAEKIRGIYEELFTMRVPGLRIGSGDPLASQLRQGGEVTGGCTASGGCSAGVAGITIMSDGSVSPCRRLGITIGNVLSDSLRELWSTSPVLEGLRDKGRYTGRCGSCERWASCRGCRAIAYAHALSMGSDDYLAGDPQCFL